MVQRMADPRDMFPARNRFQLAIDGMVAAGYDENQIIEECGEYITLLKKNVLSKGLTLTFVDDSRRVTIPPTVRIAEDES